MSLLAVLAVAVHAQQTVNMKFGKPTKEEMTMTVYEQDPQADAVVLCRLTKVEYTVQTNGYLVDYHEKFRIKVLKPEGARHAEVVIPYLINQNGKSYIHDSKFSLRSSSIEIGQTNQYFENNGAGSFMENAMGDYTQESVQDLKATAFNWVNGKVVKSYLKAGEAVTEKIDDTHAQVRFTIPDVRQGTVIEYEYCLHSELFYLLHDWYAQGDIPVCYASLDMDIPGYLIFNVEEQGIQRLACQCVKGSLHYKLGNDFISAPTTVTTNHYICVGRDLKAIPSDGYVWNMHDHCAGITAELKSYSLRGTMQMDYARTWDQIDKMILEDEDLGKRLDDHSPLADELKSQGLADIADEQQRAVAVFKAVTERVKWDGTYQLWPKASEQTLKDATGSNADINLLLIQSLHDVGLTASPVVLRTRDLGLLPYNFPSIRKLSSFIVAVTLTSGRILYLDASSANGYVDVLSEPLLVERARLIQKGKSGQWVNLQKLMKAQTNTVIEATLSEDGQLKGTRTTRHTGLSAVKYRETKGIKGEFAPEVTVVEEFSLQGEVNGSTISVCPFPVPPLEANPFQADSRPIPVQFPYSHSELVVVNITLPKGYVLADDPLRNVVSTPDKGIDGRYVVGAADDQVTVQYQLNVNKMSHNQKNYAELRGIFDLFASYSNKPLVFSKRN